MFQCTGMKVNAMAYQSKLSDKMEKNGSLKVDRYLLVEEIENLFAIGDCNNTPEVKEAYTARLHAGKVFIVFCYMYLTKFNNIIIIYFIMYLASEWN